MASNTKKETWFLHRIRELILNTLVSESRGTWIARISSIETAFLLLLLFPLSFFLFIFFIFLYLNDSRRLAQGTFKMKRFNADVMYVVRVDVLCMCYVSEYVRVIIILIGRRPVSLSGILIFFTFFFFFSFCFIWFTFIFHRYMWPYIDMHNTI